MTYQDTLEFLYSQLPMFQAVGQSAYKPGLQTVSYLSEQFGNPHCKFASVHVGGTNGKGSTAHTLAAILQSAGYKVGLFTSPHLLDFRERIRINGQMISEDGVIDFVKRYREMILPETCKPSFFELTTVMAFEYFAKNNIDIAIIEVGLGGRLDSTNIISPLVSVITNISLDHTALLGNTVEQIAFEKAGIIKDSVPVVIGEADGAVKDVFVQSASLHKSPIFFADSLPMFTHAEYNDKYITYYGTPWGDITGELCGEYQLKNTATILCALLRLESIGYKITRDNVATGFSGVCHMTGLAGRWTKISDKPEVVCDTGHNVGGWQYISKKLNNTDKKLHIVIGFVNDKDISGILSLMPKSAIYYFVSPSVSRGLNSANLKEIAAKFGLNGNEYTSVEYGYKAAISNAADNDMIFVGGSTFVVADLFAFIGER